MSARASTWIKGPLWDSCFMLSGLWLAPIVWFVDDVSGVYLALTLAFWIGHRVSSSYLAYCTSSYRPLLTAQRARFVWVPLAIALAVGAFLFPADDVLPWPRSQRIIALVVLDYFLNTYHFASQHYGVLSLYRLRAGHARDARAKRIDRGFALAIGGVFVVVAEVLAGAAFVQGFVQNIVQWFARDSGGGVGAGAAYEHWLARFVEVSEGTLAPAVGSALLVVATLVVLVIDRAAMSLPRALYLLALAFVVLTALWVDPLVFIVLWTVQHWTAAIGLATVVARADAAPGASLWYRAWHAVNRRPAVLLALLVVLSAALFPLMEVAAAGDAGGAAGAGGSDDLTRFVDALATSAFAPLLLALTFASAFLHYHLDRAVFRFSDAEVRRAAAGALDRAIR